MTTPTGSPWFQRVLIQDASDENTHHSATIRWKGQLQPKKQEAWLGIEYDNEHRGKHSGLFKNHQLFNTFFSKNGGSFMKAAVFEKLAITDRTPSCCCKPASQEPSLDAKFNQASQLKSTFYSSLKFNYPDFYTDGDRDFELDEINVGGKVVENVGIRYRVKKLNSITLRDEKIFIGEHDPTQHNLPATIDLAWLSSVHHLDLSLNFVSNLFTLDEIVGSILPNLKALSLSGNEINFNLLLQKRMFTHLNRIETLHLNSTNISFTDLDRLVGRLPNLKKLEIMDNLECFHEQNLLDAATNTCPSLKTLDISFNRKLTHIPHQFSVMFPNLEKLSANVCDIGDEVFRNTPTFQNLLTLDLIKNNLSEISSFDKIAEACPKLENLSYSQNSFKEYPDLDDGLETGTKTVRQIAICKVLTAKVLNRTVVGNEFEKNERLKAEYDYVNRFKNAPREQHPTYQILEDRHGRAEEDVVVKKFVEVEFENVADGKTLKKKLRLTTSVSKLKITCKKLFKHGSDSEILLTLVQTGDHRIEMENDLQTLDYYSPFDGDTIVVRRR